MKEILAEICVYALLITDAVGKRVCDDAKDA